MDKSTSEVVVFKQLKKSSRRQKMVKKSVIETDYSYNELEKFPVEPSSELFLKWLSFNVFCQKKTQKKVVTVRAVVIW